MEGFLSMPQIVGEFTFVDSSISPPVQSMTMPLIGHIISIVAVAVREPGLSCPMPRSKVPFAQIPTTILIPKVTSTPMRQIATLVQRTAVEALFSRCVGTEVIANDGGHAFGSDGEDLCEGDSTLDMLEYHYSNVKWNFRACARLY